MAEEAYPDDYGNAPNMPEDRFNKVNIIRLGIGMFFVRIIFLYI